MFNKLIVKRTAVAERKKKDLQKHSKIKFMIETVIMKEKLFFEIPRRLIITILQVVCFMTTFWLIRSSVLPLRHIIYSVVESIWWIWRGQKFIRWIWGGGGSEILVNYFSCQYIMKISRTELNVWGTMRKEGLENLIQNAVRETDQHTEWIFVKGWQSRDKEGW